MSAAVFSYMHSLHIPLSSYSFICNGDDGVIIVSRRYEKMIYDTLVAWFDKLGLIMKVEPPVYSIEEIEFCQCHPVWDG